MLLFQDYFNQGENMTINCIGPEKSYHHCDPESFSFNTTSELEEPRSFIGQNRALEAVDFGISIKHQGFNLFVIGPEGTGRHRVIKTFINEKAANEPTPDDLCYVNNFDHPHKPIGLQFPPGKAIVFKKEMHDLIDMLQTTIPAVFEGDDYRARKNVIHKNLNQKIDKLYRGVEDKAKDEKIAVVKTEDGIMFSPMDADGKKIEAKDFSQLPQDVQNRIGKSIERIQAELQKIIHQISILKREAEEQIRKLKKETAKLAVSHFINTLKAKYTGRDKVVHYLVGVEEDIIEKVDDFLYQPESHGANLLGFLSTSPSFDQYEVNVLVSHEKQGATVIYEDLPTYQNLHGRIEHTARMGVLTTHFSLIKPGALHQANGGYIILDAQRLLQQPFAYEGLKRTLRSRQVRIEPIERLLGLMSTVTLEPEPVDLKAKVVLVGSAMIYYLLHYYDPEFQSLFKVQADFEQTMDKTLESQQLFASFIARLAVENHLLPLHRSGVARIIEHAVRLAGDRDKISLHVRQLTDLMKEGEYIAGKKMKDSIDSADLEEALEAARKRGGRIKDQIFEAIDKGIRHIDTSGLKVGQVNGLSVIALGSDSFGTQTRITALTRPGKGEVVDIEREVELGGPIHSKGVMILESFLSSRYVRTMPLCLRASLVFEQSYGGVEGDSASCAELCALLSSLADFPLKQSIAITGSISQQGEVQAIGGVNEKIEGFFDLCRQRGLTGEQGVIIPASNERHLMLKKEVVQAMVQKKFFLWSVTSVDDAIELLTGMTAGIRDSEENYPAESINGRVEATLVRFVKDIQKFDKAAEKKD